MVESPRKPSSKASLSISFIWLNSASVAFSPLVKALSMPIAFIRISECPIKEVMFMPNGRLPMYSFHSPGVFQVFRSSNNGSMISLGIASTLVKLSEVSSGVLYIADTEQLPNTTVVTPCRADSLKPGETMTSAS